MGSKTLHPLVSVIDLSKADLSSHTDFKFGFYTILLSECKCEAYRYGHQYYDFSDGTLLCLTPGESISMKDSDNTRPSKGWILAFHPDLICGTALGANIRDYTFFSYRPEEALHVSLREKQVILELLDKINEELQRCIDCYSRRSFPNTSNYCLIIANASTNASSSHAMRLTKRLSNGLTVFWMIISILYKVSPPIFPLLRSASEYFVFLPHISMICWNMKQGSRTKNTFSSSVSR